MFKRFYPASKIAILALTLLLIALVVDAGDFTSFSNGVLSVLTVFVVWIAFALPVIAVVHIISCALALRSVRKDDSFSTISLTSLFWGDFIYVVGLIATKSNKARYKLLFAYPSQLAKELLEAIRVFRICAKCESYGVVWRELDAKEIGTYRVSVNKLLDCISQYKQRCVETPTLFNLFKCSQTVTTLSACAAKHIGTGTGLDDMLIEAKTLSEEPWLLEIQYFQRVFPVGIPGNIFTYEAYNRYYHYFHPETIAYVIAHPQTEILKSTKEKSVNVDYDNMEGHQFEYFCADLLRANGYYDVEVTRGSGDQGIDVLASRDGVTFGIQCKCYASDVGNSAVQEAHSGKAYYDCQVAVVMTNRHFTRSAKELSRKIGVVLWDRETVQKFTDEYLRQLADENNKPCIPQ
ncbi:MAG: restriction endonuclease [Alistipes sp.]|nr:restriction endonuclease [Alistipes sp.]